jgi:hypothetical protein
MAWYHETYYDPWDSTLGRACCSLPGRWMMKLGLTVLFALLSLQSPTLAQTSLQRSQNQSSGNPIPPAQSLQPTPSTCDTGGQSVRVCSNDFQSCSSVCTAAALDPTADPSACSARCCNQLQICLSIRGCRDLVSVNCFTAPGTLPGSSGR